MLTSQHHLTEEGDPQIFEGVQVMLHSDHHFGPRSIRELTVRGAAAWLLSCLAPPRLAVKLTAMATNFIPAAHSLIMWPTS